MWCDVGWFKETPEETAARKAKYGARAEAHKAKLQAQLPGSPEQQAAKQYLKNRKAERFFSFGDVHVFPDCIVRTADGYAGTYPVVGVSARVEESWRRAGGERGRLLARDPDPVASRRRLAEDHQHHHAHDHRRPGLPVDRVAARLGG